MKRKILFLVCILSLISTIAQAMERPSLGGITLGSSLEYIQSIYGPAAKEPKSSFGHDCDDFTYGKDKSVLFTIYYNDPKYRRAGELVDLTTKKNNGFSTTEGIHVGSTLQEALALYGDNVNFYYLEGTGFIYLFDASVEKKRSAVKKVLKSRNLTGEVEVYYGKDSKDDCYLMRFSNGIITSIELSYPFDFD